jgi:osmoprotectant transport system ATP-binding protein
MSRCTVPAVIEFDRVDFFRGAQPILRKLTFAIARGETFALVGRSGSGKSTTVKLVNRMLEPYDGSVRVDGRDTRAWDSTLLRRHCGYVLQDVGLFPHMTVARNVAVVPLLERWAESRVAQRTDDLLSLVGLPPDEYRTRWPAELSGGQRQRVGVARALAADPPVLLMDEPFGALDAVTRGELHREFRRIQQQLRKTCVIVTHDVREASVLADRIGILDNGALIACGTPAEIGRSAVPAVAALLQP